MLNRDEEQDMPAALDADDSALVFRATGVDGPAGPLLEVLMYDLTSRGAWRSCIREEEACAHLEHIVDSRGISSMAVFVFPRYGLELGHVRPRRCVQYPYCPESGAGDEAIKSWVVSLSVVLEVVDISRGEPSVMRRISVFLAWPTERLRPCR